MALPFFSVIVTTHNRANLLKRCLHSILANSFADHEVILVSDHHDPATHSAAAELLRPQDTFIRRPSGGGPAQSRNLGLQLVRGKYVLFIDDDDAFLPRYFAELHAATSKYPGHAIFTNPRVIEEDRNQLEAPPIKVTDHSLSEADLSMLWIKNYIQNHTIVYPHSAVRGRQQSPALRSLEDWDFLLNVASDTPLVHQPILGAITYKDFVNDGTRRSSSEQAKGINALADYLHIYRRWPAPSPEIRELRQVFLSSNGFAAPIEWI